MSTRKFALAALLILALLSDQRVSEIDHLSDITDIYTVSAQEIWP